MEFNDHTTETEERVLSEQKPKLRHLFRLFYYAFNCTRGICMIYLGAFLLLSLMWPMLALLWGRYIQMADTLSEGTELVAAICLLAAYFAVWFLTELLQRYVYLYDEAEQLNVVQANRQQEKLYAKLYRKLASLSPQYFEIPKMNDRIEQVFRFTTAKVDGLNTSVMLQGYVVISKIISVITIAFSLYIFDPWLCLIVLLAPLPTVWNRTAGQKLKFEFMKDNTGLMRKADYFQGVMLSFNGKELKTFGLYDFFYQKWKQAADEYTVREQQGEGCRETVSAVFQDPARYLTFSIAENIYLGDIENPRDKQRMRGALSFAGLEESDANQFLGKEIGGTDLSGGQWQKLAIARSVYRRKGMFILDEPTSGLDPLAEAEILKKYLDMAKNRTVVFVTHRMGVAAMADRIIVFSGGRIVQQGTHEQLIMQKGEYARLYREQARWYKR